MGFGREATPPKNGKPLEDLALQVAQKLFPEATIGHESHVIEVPIGDGVKKYVPDLDFSFPGSPIRTVWTEMTCSPIRVHGDGTVNDPKRSQLNVLEQHVANTPDEAAFVYYAQNMATENAFIGTLTVLEELGTGKISPTEARERVLSIAQENEVFTLGVTTSTLYEEVLKGMLK